MQGTKHQGVFYNEFILERKPNGQLLSAHCVYGKPNEPMGCERQNVCFMLNKFHHRRSSRAGDHFPQKIYLHINLELTRTAVERRSESELVTANCKNLGNPTKISSCASVCTNNCFW